MSILSTHKLSLERGGRWLYQGLDLCVEAGEIWAVLGPNGAGKSSLLLQLAGLLPSPAGSVHILDRPLADWRLRALAQVRAWLPQDPILGVPMRVRDRVWLGRHPQLGWRGRPGPADAAQVEAALAHLDLLPLAERWLHELSGGERQRVLLAAGMAQTPRLLLADEPSNHLDPRHQVQWLAWLREHVNATGGAALLALHDPNLAARFCDHALLFLPTGELRGGPSTSLLRAGPLSAVYDCPVGELPGPGFPVFYWQNP